MKRATEAVPGDENETNLLSRREVIVGAVTIAALTPLRVLAQSSDTQSREDENIPADAFKEFIDISAALTGILSSRLVAGADPVQNVKTRYFNLATADKVAYPKLQKTLADNKNQPRDVIGSALLATDGAQQLAQSIIMAWYFGVWYEWNGADPIRFTIVSSDAYTEGWIWRIANAHPPGYSNLRFGHWAFPPPPDHHLPGEKTEKKS